MRIFQTISMTLLAISIAAPAMALDPCGTGTAVLRGGFTQNMPGMGDYVYEQEMRLEHKGGGMTRLWIGSYYSQSSIYPFALDAKTRAAVMMGTSTVEGVDALCIPELPDANTIKVPCTGRFPFTFHANGTITWEGGGQVIGEYTKTGITIDMQRGAPGYAAQKVVSGKMSGVPTLAGGMTLLLDMTADGLVGASTIPAHGFTIKGRAEPSEGASVTLFGSVTNKVGVGPIIVTPPAPDTVQVILRHAAPNKRAEQAQGVRLTLTADWGKGCHKTSVTTLFDAMLLTGTPP